MTSAPLDDRFCGITARRRADCHWPIRDRVALARGLSPPRGRAMAGPISLSLVGDGRKEAPSDHLWPEELPCRTVVDRCMILKMRFRADSSLGPRDCDIGSSRLRSRCGGAWALIMPLAAITRELISRAGRSRSCGFGHRRSGYVPTSSTVTTATNREHPKAIGTRPVSRRSGARAMVRKPRGRWPVHYRSGADDQPIPYCWRDHPTLDFLRGAHGSRL